MKSDGSEWIVVIRVPEGSAKPYMSEFRDGTRFTVRTGNRKRAMTYAEIQHDFLANPQQTYMAQVLAEMASIKSLIIDLGVKLGR